MGLRIANNIAALNAHRNLSITDSNMSRSVERLSSGYRINRAKDDAAGLSMAKKFESQIRSLTVASRNTTQANALLQIAEGGADQIENMLIRLKELATQAASSQNNDNLTDINAEASELLAEVDRIANATTFQGTSLLTGYGTKVVSATDLGNFNGVANVYDLDVSGAGGNGSTYIFSTGAAGSYIALVNSDASQRQVFSTVNGANTYDFTSLGVSFKTTGAATSNTIASVASAVGSIAISGDEATFQVGDGNHANYRISFEIDSMTKTSLSVGNVDLSSLANAQSSIDMVDNAIDAINSSRGEIGATQNKLDYTYASLAISIENSTAASSVIQDVDMAMEMSTFTKTQIMMQAGTAMLAQANMAPQQILSLFG